MDDAGFDPAELVSNDQIDGATYMVRALNFVYLDVASTPIC